MAKESSEVKSLWRRYIEFPVIYKILIALILGAIVGAIVGKPIAVIKPIGDLFIRLLKMIVMPIVLASLVVGAASIHPARLGRVGVKIMIYYIITSAFAVCFGLLMANLFKPGLGLALQGPEKTIQAAPPSAIDVLLNIVPKNPFAALVQGQVLPTIFFAIILGIAISYLMHSENERLRKSGTTLFEFFDGFAEAMYKIVRGVLEYAPYGVFALIAVVVGEQGPGVLGPLGKVVAAVYIGLALQIFIVYGLVLKIFGFNIIKFIAKIKEAMVTAFVTRSSSGTLPVTMRVAEEQVGVDRGIYSFTLPLGATINMDGTALYQGVCAMFIAFAIGQPLSITQQLMVVLTAVLASIGTAGVPSAGLIMLAMVLESVGLPIEPGTAVAVAYGMIAGIDAILDMGRTMVNVTGDLVGTTIVAKTEKALDMSKWQ